ncbi:MAG: hypothetical protein ACRBDL_08615 [Alphaproteobacteria bacterium]
MDWVKKIAEGINKVFGDYTQNIHEFKTSLTPENVLAKLREYNLEPNVIKASENPKNAGEGLLESFKIAKNSIQEDQIVEMARYMSTNNVFSRAIHQFPITTLDEVLSGMFTRCPPEDRAMLLEAFETTGHMKHIAQTEYLSGMHGTQIYIKSVATSLPDEEAINLLKHTESFQIARHMNDNIDEYISLYHPEYEELIRDKFPALGSNPPQLS